MIGERWHPALHIVVYSTGHGFGHASRDYEIVAALHRLEPAARIHLRTPVAGWFIDAALDGIPHTRSEARLDVGIRQADGITQDIPATVEACQSLLADRARLLVGEREALRALGATLVVSDVPAIPLAAAADLGIPSLALGNFTWSWIYRDLGVEAPALGPIADRFDADYARADALVRLPFGHDDFARPFRHVVEVALVARRSALEVTEARRRLGLDPARPVVLVTFGGLGPSAIDLVRLTRLDGYTFLLTPPGPDFEAPNVRVVGTAELQARGLRFADLVRASDVVASKPGYGIVSECLANQTRFLYTSRGDFAEYPILVEGIERLGVARFIDNAQMREGDWGEALDALMGRARRPCALPLDGADEAARLLLSRA